MPLIRRMAAAHGSGLPWKAIDPDEASARACWELGVWLDVRMDGPWDQDASLFDAAAFLALAQAKPWWPYCAALETPNEPYPGQPVPGAYIQQEAALVRLLRSQGRKCIVSNRSTGWAGHEVPGATYYGAHFYRNPRNLTVDGIVEATWWFSKIESQNRNAHLLLTELGATEAVDGGPDQGGGWRAASITPGEYWSYLAGVDAALTAQTPGYAGALLFQEGAFPDWAAHEALGDLDDSMAAQAPAQAQGQGRNAMPEPEFKLGIAAEAARLKALGVDVGTPLEDEQAVHAIPGGDEISSYQETTAGLFWYSRAGNTVHFFVGAGK